MIDFFDLLKLQGYPVKEAFKKWDQIQGIKCMSLWQKEQAWRMVNYHFLRNGGYAACIEQVPQNWLDLPLLNKDVMRQFALNDKKWLNKKEKYYFASTSGSSGNPFNFSKDLFSHTLTWIQVAHCYGCINVTLNDLQARFYGIPSTKVAGSIERVKDFVGHRYRFPILDLSDSALEAWIKIFSGKSYAYLYGYSYPLITFAKYLERTHRVLKEIVPSLKGAILTAEMCDYHERMIVEKAFGVPVCNEYGASEFGILGFAKNEYWEIPQQLLMIEILDDQGNMLPFGTLGNITVTSLFNKGTPFIRYQTGDLGVMDVIDGRQVLTQLYGRREDMAVLPSGKKTPGDTAFYYVFKDFAAKYDVLIEYKIVQKNERLFDILYTAKRDFNKAEEDYLKRLCENSLEKDIAFRLLHMDEIDRTRMGKFRRFVSEVR